MGLRIVNGVPYFDGKSGGWPEGTRACSYCLQRPARVDRSRVQSYCRVCATEANRRSRKGKINTLLSPEERMLILELRQVRPAGRHHAARLCAAGLQAHRSRPGAADELGHPH